MLLSDHGTCHNTPVWPVISVPYNYRPAVVMVTHYNCPANPVAVMAMNRCPNPGFYYYLCLGPFKGEQSNNCDH
ncbi:hypothetical protein GCM10022210_22930 [Mucilaginibacter dorajii]|uniref:Uncharacterized protein n=1 Tax=Mucilaginibacter dorajii TaxID=692994 RepID=A0ABP7PWN6_9SPHI